MKKQRLIQIALLLVILFVWGKIVYDRGFNSGEDTNVIDENYGGQHKQYTFLDAAILAMDGDDTGLESTVSFDPFYAKASRNKKQRSYIGNKTVEQSKAAIYKTHITAHYQNTISYQGLVGNKSKKRRQAILNINGSALILTAGEWVGDSIKLKSFDFEKAIFRNKKGVEVELLKEG